MKYSFLALPLILLLVACKPTPKEQSVFKLPILINTQNKGRDTCRNFNVNALMPDFQVYAGKYKWNDTLNIDPAARDTSFRKDLLEGWESAGIDDSLDVNGFEMYVDYATTVYYDRRAAEERVSYSYYPVYFVNSSSKNKIFAGKDSYVFGLQEAKQQYQWYAIELSGYDFCGNGYWGMLVRPGEVVVVLIKKYQGTVDVELRTRIAVGNSIYVSKPYKGKINPRQFYIHEEMSYLKERINPANSYYDYLDARYLETVPEDRR